MTSPSAIYDVFISHASEDKARFVDALDVALRERGLTCWYDARAIQLGDDFRRRMDEGLSRARFGVVVLSPHFFKVLAGSRAECALQSRGGIRPETNLAR